MIKEFVLSSCGPLDKIHWQVSPRLNLILGHNGTGKSLILKFLYAILRATGEYQRGDSTTSFKSILGDKLRGTFQVDQVGEIVKKGSRKLKCECRLDNQTINFTFSPSAVLSAGDVSEMVKPTEILPLFLPPKEILSITPVIERSRMVDKLKGFDNTYLELAFALKGEPQKGQTFANLARARFQLSKLFHGRLIQDGETWQFKEGNIKHSIHMTAEGVKRLALIDRLIGNRSLYPGATLFIDEPEAMLHPKAIVEFMEILHLLAMQDIQVFMATHSYFVLKALYIIARREETDIRCLSLNTDEPPSFANLKEGIPDNPIIDESISLYEREIDVEL